MDKPSIYLDTNIVSVLHYRGGQVQSLAWQIATREWWERERRHYRVFASRVVEDELLAGAYPGQAMALAEVRRLAYLPFSRAVRDAASAYLTARIVPEAKMGDALQLAFATVHGVDYLLTWNHAHLANLRTQETLAKFHETRGWRTPLLVSPDTVPKVLLGQAIRRRD